MRHVPRRFAILAFAVIVVLVTGGTFDARAGDQLNLTTSTPSKSGESCAHPNLPATAAYAEIAGVDPNLTSLDVHAPDNACGAPVVMWVHGGGYAIGDKSNQMADKVSLFNDHGWILVSVNYRLTVAGDPTPARFPDHFADVAGAVAWVHAHIAAYGGDPTRLALLGHSAGADLVANVVTNPTYLANVGLGLDAVTCAGPLDTEGFDKTASEAGEKAQWVAAFGNNPNYLTETSATLLVKPGIGIPPVIGVVRGTTERQKIEAAFLDTLEAAGISVTRIDASSLTHAQVNNQIGQSGDTVMTAPIVTFLTNCFSTHAK